MTAKYQKPDPFSTPTFQAIRDFLEESQKSALEGSKSLEVFERELHRRLMAFEAEIMGTQLARYDLDADGIEVQGQQYRLKMKSQQEYSGLAGTFTIERNLYVPRTGDGKAMAPLELRAGIVEGYWTPLAARVMARAVASTTPKEAEGLFEEFGGMKPSTSSLDRLPKYLSEEWEENREAFEGELRNQEQVPREAAAVGVSLDGVQVPMKDGDRAEKRSQEDKRPQGPAGYREVGCGTVTLYDREGNRLQTIRYARMPEEKKVTLKSQLEIELWSILRTRPDLDLVRLADGAIDNWEFLDLLPERLGRDPNKDKDKAAVDLYHVLERVKKALDAYHGDQTPESKAAFEECRIWFREKYDGAERVIRALRYRRDRSRGTAKCIIKEQIKYLEKRKDLMRYKRLLDKNLPVGSGVVEAACKTLAAERMKRSGMSWRDEGGQAILTLRSLIQTDRWNAGWSLLASQYKIPVIVTKLAA
jgi:hypothetical protein